MTRPRTSGTHPPHRHGPAWLDLPQRTGRRATLAQLGVCALSGALMVLASPPYSLWPLAWIAMAPALWLWARAGTVRRAGLLGWATGAAMSIGGFYWFAGLMHQHAGLPWPVALLCLFALAAYQGLPLLITARVVWRVRRRWRALPLALIAPPIYVATEHVWPVIFPYQIAISQAPAVPVIQIADLLGAPAITALLIASAAAVHDLIEGRRRAAIGVGVAIALTLAYGFWRVADVASTRDAAPHVKIGLIQPNEPMSLGPHDREAEIARLAAIQAESGRLEAAGAQLLIWSETAYPATLARQIKFDSRSESPWRIRREFTVPVVIGAITEEKRPGKRPLHYNSSLLVVGERVIARHDKVHRVLGSEWNPVTEWIPSLEGTLPPGFAGGDGPVILPVDAGGVALRLAPMICLEDVVARFARTAAAEHPNLLVNQTIDTWFGTFAEPYQHRALAVLRTVEVRADMVRAVNTGPSGLIEATGRLGPQTAVRATDPGVEGIVVEPAVIEAGHSIYARIGDLFAWLCVAASIYGWWFSRERWRQRKRSAR